uniref:Uncharacterized protein n=1 Tax=Anguilla anguilla TaxID=7936 RepID=A0A0E9PE05_ANGAN
MLSTTGEKGTAVTVSSGTKIPSKCLPPDFLRSWIQRLCHSGLHGQRFHA